MNLADFVNKMVLAGCPVVSIDIDSFDRACATFHVPNDPTITFHVYNNAAFGTNGEEWVANIPYMDARTTRIDVDTVDQTLSLALAHIPA